MEVLSADCAADIDIDGQVSVGDLLILLAQWGPCPVDCDMSCGGDIDGSGVVDVEDLLILLSAWGPCA